MTRTTIALATLVGGAFAAASATFPLADPDLYWHLATARETLAHGLVRSDVFSWTASGVPLGTDQWLGELALYAAYVTGSWTGVLVLRTLAVGALVALAVAAALVRRPASPLVAIGVALPAILLSRFVWAARPELLGAVFLAAFVLLLQLPGARPLYAAAALLVVWANVHGSFALGAALALLVAAIGLATDATRRRAYAALAVGAVLSTVLTPAGIGTLGAPGLHLLDPPRQIQEWALPDPTTLPGAVWAIVVGLVVLAASVGARPRARDVALVVPTLVLSLTAVRQLPLFAVATTPYLAGSLPLPRAFLPDPSAPPPRAAVAVLVALGIALPALAVATAPATPDETAFPVAALERLPRGRGLLAEYDWGGWLIWRAPDTPVFVDGRLVPYRGAVLDDYARVIEARPGWRDVLARRDVRWLLVRPADPVAVRARELGWRELASSPTFTLVEVGTR